MTVSCPRVLWTSLATIAFAGAASAQCDPTTFGPPDSVAVDDQFGAAVLMLGHRAMIGAPEESADPGSPSVGAVHVYLESAGGWVPEERVLASDGAAGDGFGTRLAGGNGRLFVSAPWNDAQGVNSGAVYVFERIGGSWTETAKLVGSDVAAGDLFGVGLSADGDRVLVGAPLHNGVAGADVGKAYLFERQADGTWLETLALSPLDGAQNDWFGRAVAIRGNRFLIGSPQDDDAGSQSGGAYVYELVAGVWVLGDKLAPPSPGSGDRFGYSVAIEGTTAFVGAYLDDQPASDSGGVYVFDRQPAGSWTLSQVLVHSGATSGDQFGSVVAAEGSFLLVGAPRIDRLGHADNGAAVLFELEAGTWTEKVKLFDRGFLEGSSFFGDAVAVSGGGALVGEPQASDPNGQRKGSAYLFPALSIIGGEFCHCDSGPCNNADPESGCRNLTGAGAWLHGCGSTSVSLDDLVLVAEQVPANQFGIFYMGPVQGQTLFGDGVRCVFSGNGVGVFRYPLQVSSPDGVMGLGPGIVAQTQELFPPPGRIQAGQTWNFQAWFRDPLGPCGSDFNLSNALELSFVP